METIKSYTDLEQSKVLAKILPLKSADMYYATWTILDNEFIVSPNQGSTIEDLQEDYGNQIIPCWSLTALLSVLPTLDDRNAEFCKDIRYDKWHVYYHSTATLPMIDTERYDNLVDACYEMILKLNELNLL